MAAVQDLFRRLKLRRSLNKRSKSKDNAEDAPDAPRLGDRVGVALPPVPPPGFNLNLPDISRDCVHSPTPQVYDEIPAYAIDTRLDILREAYWERKGVKPQHGLPTESNNNTSSQNAFGYPRDHHEGHWGRDRVPQRHSSLPRQHHEASRRHEEPAAVSRRRGTPWHRGYDSDCDDSAASDQLDQWVSVQESLHALSTEDIRVNRTSQQMQHPVQQRPWYEEDSHIDTRPRNVQDFPHGVQNSTEHIPRRHYHQIPPSAAPQDRDPAPSTSPSDVKYPSPSPGALSDDSGVSSPSNRDSQQGSWGKKSVPRLFHSGQYSDSESSTYCGNPQALPNRWHTHDSNASDVTSQMTSHRAHLDTSCEGSSDTYNEYDQNNSSFSEFGSLSRDHRAKESSMSPQEYMFYLGKIQKNFTKTHDVRQLNSGSVASDSLESHYNSFDLTSVTSLSEMSTLSDEEIHQLTREFEADLQARSNQVARKAEAKVSDTKQPMQHQHSSSTSQSAFKPYASQRRHSHTPESQPEPRTTSSQSGSRVIPNTMTLEDKLSCRATTSKPRPHSALQKGSATQLPASAQRSFNGVQSQSRRPSQNMLLSDIMRINHDRQILGML